MVAFTIIDYPHCRNDVVCPVCMTPKDKGPFVCFPCYRYHEVRYGLKPYVKTLIDTQEAALAARDKRVSFKSAGAVRQRS